MDGSIVEVAKTTDAIFVEGLPTGSSILSAVSRSLASDSVTEAAETRDLPAGLCSAGGGKCTQECVFFGDWHHSSHWRGRAPLLKSTDVQEDDDEGVIEDIVMLMFVREGCPLFT